MQHMAGFNKVMCDLISITTNINNYYHKHNFALLTIPILWYCTDCVFWFGNYEIHTAKLKETMI